MVIINYNKPVAYSDGDNIVAIQGVEQYRLPYTLFFDSRIANKKFWNNWIEDRVPPRDRLDINRVLAGYGLKEYDLMKLVEITRARSIGADNFWVILDVDITETSKINKIIAQVVKKDKFWNL